MEDKQQKRYGGESPPDIDSAAYGKRESGQGDPEMTTDEFTDEDDNELGYGIGTEADIDEEFNRGPYGADEVQRRLQPGRKMDSAEEDLSDQDDQEMA